MTASSDNNRLDRIERILEANSSQIEANTRNIDRLESAIGSLVRIVQEHQINIEDNARKSAQLEASVNSLVRIVEVHQSNFELTIAEIRSIGVKIEEMQAEVKGLQTESLRIQQRLFGEEENP